MILFLHSSICCKEIEPLGRTSAGSTCQVLFLMPNQKYQIEGCKRLTVLVYFYSHCHYITTVAPFVHLYDTKPDVLMNDVRLDG